MMTLKHKIVYGLMSVCLLLMACTADKQENIDITDVIDTTDAKKGVSAEKVFNTMPNSELIYKLCQHAKAEYNSSLLNDPYNINSYTIESSKALNLGVYGADLNVTNVFEQSQESMLFLKCVNGLAKSIGVSNAFDEKMIDRMEKNKTNKDSTLYIVSQAFKNADIYLQKNGRHGTSSLLIAGAWIEGLYVACGIANETKNKTVIREIFNQNESLVHLIELLQQANISEDVAYVLTELTELNNIFDRRTHASDFSIEALLELNVKLTSLRTKIISAN